MTETAMTRKERMRKALSYESIDHIPTQINCTKAFGQTLAAHFDIPFEQLPDYLGNHLKAVVARREQQGAVEILGLGVGLDLSPFYRRCLATDMSQALDNGLFFDIARLIGRGARR